MYHSLKKILYKIITREQLFRYEVGFRHLYSLLYRGSKHKCPICSIKLSSYINLKNGDKICPKCGSLSRDRRLWTLLDSEFLKDGATVLDFSPSRPLARKMTALKSINYLNTDLSGNFISKYNFDITNLPLLPDTVDLIICYHILEHIVDDKKAISELYRVLKPGSICLIQTPYKEGAIYEDFSITDPEERRKHFGQDDHVRYYSVAGLKERLEQAGFTTEVRNYGKDEYEGLTGDETIFVLSKS